MPRNGRCQHRPVFHCTSSTPAGSQDAATGRCQNPGLPIRSCTEARVVRKPLTPPELQPGSGLEALFVQTCPKAPVFPGSGGRGDHKGNSPPAMHLFLSQTLGSLSLNPGRPVASICLRRLDTSSPPFHSICSSSRNLGFQVLGVLSTPTFQRIQPPVSSGMGARSSANISTLTRARAFPRLYRASHRGSEPHAGLPRLPACLPGLLLSQQLRSSGSRRAQGCDYARGLGSRLAPANPAAPASQLRPARPDRGAWVVWGGYSTSQVVSDWESRLPAAVSPGGRWSSVIKYYCRRAELEGSRTV